MPNLICHAYGMSITAYSSANEMVFDDSTDSEIQAHLLFQGTSSELKEIARTHSIKVLLVS